MFVGDITMCTKIKTLDIKFEIHRMNSWAFENKCKTKPAHNIIFFSHPLLQKLILYSIKVANDMVLSVFSFSWCVFEYNENELASY